jgi:tetratricopeptide (TPR) repeat protein
MEINLDNHHDWFNRGKILASIGRHEEALTCYDRAIALSINYYEAWCEKGVVLEKLERQAEADICFNYALGVFSNDLEDSLSDDRLLSIPSDSPSSNYYNMACFQALQGNPELAIAKLQQAIALLPEKYRVMAEQDSDLDNLRTDRRFEQLLKASKDLLV